MVNILSTIGLYTGILGALVIALNLGLFFFGYILFTISSISWCLYAYITKQRNLLILNITFGIINIIGLVRFF